MNVLLVEDERRVADFVQRGLRAEGHATTPARTGREGLELGRGADFDVIILDLMLPEMHGLEVCQRLRSAGVLTPILVLTAMDGIEDRVEGLRLGADDYLTKPFAFDELIARLEALVRRARNFEVESSRIELADLVFDRETLEVHRGGERIELTAKELAILELLLSAPGKVFSRQRILSLVWGYTADPLTNVVDVYIARLRKKIDVAGVLPLIETVRGHGYRIVKAP